ncbi:MAG TPA: DNA translocase FtsK 4TM domain-containing protein [Candidatus Saccharimonadaceae bacterium]|nr:DNA translocase FtsK 4TM domain-containing protein [Candidatus Saccharimonadaceae bacterium]
MASSLSEKRQRQIVALLLGAFAVLSLASVASYQAPLPGFAPWASPNACGPVGAALAFSVVWGVGRLAAFGVPLLAGAWSWNRFRDRPMAPMVVSSVLGVLLVFESCTLLGLGGAERWAWAGGWGFAASLALRSALGGVGSWIVAGALFGVTALAASELGFHWIGRLAHGTLVRPVTGSAAWLAAWRARRAAEAKKPRIQRPRTARDAARAPANEALARPRMAEAPRIEVEPDGQTRLPLTGLRETKPKAKPKAGANGAAVPTEAFPSLSLLAMPTQPEDLITAADLTAEANLLTAKLADFGVVGRVTEIHPGPVVTTFEFEPAAGVKVNSIVSREDDLALALRAQRIRILAPIPGKGAVGVEIPNRRRRTVYLREVLSASAYETSDAALKVPLGVDVVGQPFVADLTKMPHVLVAGATGSGKSVCLNAIITGLLFQHGPDTLRMVMVDPKMLELSAYNGIPHLVMPVVTEPKRASRALRWAVSEMEKRYKLMATCGARNIAAYNDKVAAGLVPTAPGAGGAEPAPPERLSYVVVVIDELADLMLTAPAEIEEPIARLAQMARAVGIHLVLATQRPSVDVITGVIKANFPSRIAFQVASKTDSRTVLDMNGAENLLGHGDMLFTPAGKPEPYRVHGAYVSEEETARVVEFWRAKANPAEPVPLATDASIVDREEEQEAALGGEVDDTLIGEAARLVVSHQQGSTSLLQRRLKVGYSRAGRLMDQLEQLGVVGPFQGSKARDVLVDERWLSDRGYE